MVLMVLLGLGLAFAYCLPPGAVTAAALRQGARFGWSGAFGIELGSVIGDAAYGVLAIAGLLAALRLPWARTVLGVLGLLLLAYLGYQGLAEARRPVAPAANSGDRRSFWSAFGLGAGLSLANPMAIPFWLSFGGAAVALAGPHRTVGSLWMLFASFASGCMLWGIAVSLGISYLRRYLTPRLMRLASLVSGLALLGFALALGVSLLTA